jgi:fucose permease
VSAELGFGNWIVSVVSKSAGISLALADPVATAFFIGLTAGRLGGAQLLRRGWLSEKRLLYLALLGGTLAGVLVAIFPGQLLIVYGASALVGCFYGPLFPSIMAITSRRFARAIGPVSSVMMIGTGASSMLVPALMGALIAVLGINWVIAIPALCCLLMLVPMALANRAQRTTLQSPAVQHTIEQTAGTPILP